MADTTIYIVDRDAYHAQRLTDALKSDSRYTVSNFQSEQALQLSLQEKSNGFVEDMIQEERPLREHVSTIVHYYLSKYNNDVLKVAEVLEIGKSTIYRMLKSEREAVAETV